MAITRKKAPEKKLPSAAPGPGHNAPPTGDLAVLTADYEEHRVTAQQWLDFGDLDDDEAAEAAGNFAKQCAAKKKAVDNGRLALTRPLDKKKKDIMDEWNPLAEKFERLRQRVMAKVDAYAKAKRDRIAAAQEEARKAAEAETAALAAAEDRALANPNSLAAVDDLDDARARAARAEREEREARRTTATVGAGTTAGGIKRSISLRTFETLHVTDRAALMAELVALNCDMTGVDEALLTAFRAARRDRGETKGTCGLKGLEARTEEKGRLMPRQHLSPQQKALAYSLIPQHCKVVGGYAQYEDTWSDEAIYAAVQERYPEPEITKAQIVYIRRKLVARDLPPPEPDNREIYVGAATAEHIGELTKMINGLRSEIAVLRQRISALEGDMAKQAQLKLATVDGEIANG